MRLILVRHGETDWNDKLKLQSFTNNPLNEKGIRNVEKAAQVLKTEKINVIISSPLLRAKQTAEIINKYHNQKIDLDERLTERNFGKLDGMNYLNFSSKLKEIHENNALEQYEIERLENVRNRTNEFLKDLFENHFNKTILVTSHSSALKMLISIIINEPFGIFSKKKKKNASISIIEFEEPYKVKSKQIAMDGHLN